ncbi:MAG: alpha-hydroxy acid oxidase [Acidobacteriota bacterium]
MPAVPPINLLEYEEAAREQLSEMAYDYYASGAHDELTLRANRAAFNRYQLQYRVLRDVSTRDVTCSLLGSASAAPIFVAPMAFHRLAHDDGELATARAAGRRGLIFTLSTMATRSIEEVTEVATGPIWFQLYVYRDRGLTRELVERAAQAGCRALVLTVDAQVFGVRERDVRNRFRLPEGMEVKNLLGTKNSTLPKTAGSGLGAYVESLFDPALSWRDVEWLASLSDLPVVIKGIVHPDDAVLAARHGAQAVVVSNHGGRQLDTAPATLDVLSEIADAAGDQVEIFMDGGVRRGTDVVKALALGAKAVSVGRPVLWGLAAGGEDGAGHVLDLLRAELDKALALCGATDLKGLKRDLLRVTERPASTY